MQRNHLLGFFISRMRFKIAILFQFNVDKRGATKVLVEGWGAKMIKKV